MNETASTNESERFLTVLAEKIAADVVRLIEGKSFHPPQIRKLLYTIDEAAVALGRSRRGVEGLIQQRKLPVRRNDRRVQIHVKDLEAFAERDVV